MSETHRYPGSIGLVGLGLGALAGVLAAPAAAYDWAEGPARSSFGEAVFEYERSGAAVGIVGAVLITATMMAPWLWARLTGIGLVAGFGTVYAILVLAARTSTDFEVEAEVDLLTGSHLAIIAFFASAAGLALALIGGRAGPAPERQFAPLAAPAGDVPPAGYGYGRLPPLDAPPPPPASPGTSGKAIASLVLGILGLVTILAPPLSALAVAFSNLARVDIRRAGGRLGGGGMATAGLVLGLIGLAFSALILMTMMFVLTPDETGTFD